MTCCVTGHRSKNFPFERSEKNFCYTNYITTVYEAISQLIYEGYDHFISGMAEGADMDFAHLITIAQSLGNEYITLEAALPYPIPRKKTLSDKDIALNMLLMQCKKKTVVTSFYHRGCMQKRNRYMVDQSDLVLAIWNGKKQGGTWNTIQYAIKQGKEIRYIMLNEMNLW